MDVVCYVDLLNEYPLWYDLEWIQEQLNQRSNASLFEKNNPDANVRNELFTKKGRFNALQTRFYQELMNPCLQRLRARCPKLDIFACETGGSVAQDYRHHAAIDKHFWFTQHAGFAKAAGFTSATPRAGVPPSGMTTPPSTGPSSGKPPNSPSAAPLSAPLLWRAIRSLRMLVVLNGQGS